MKHLRKLLIVPLFFLIFSACGEEDRCFTCSLNITVVDVCTDNYREFAERDNVEVGSLEEYISAIRGSGFDCVEIQ